VVANSNDGKTLNSNGVLTKIVVSSMMTAIVIFSDSSKSMNAAGKGTKMTNTLAIIAIGSTKSCNLLDRPGTPPACGTAAVAIHLSGIQITQIS
jgi:hypothetical protein